jgi:hypothetical protein
MDVAEATFRLKKIYNDALVRDPTPEEIADNIDDLTIRKVSYNRKRDELLHSQTFADFRTEHDDEFSFLARLFNNILQRSPNVLEESFHASRLVGGKITKDALKLEFLSCPELLAKKA